MTFAKVFCSPGGLLNQPGENSRLLSYYKALELPSANVLSALGEKATFALWPVAIIFNGGGLW